MLARRAAREVAADDAELGQFPARRAVEARLDVAPFGVELLVAEAEPHRARAPPAVEAHARVALLLGEVEVALHAGDLVEAALDRVGLAFDLLHAHTIGAHAFGPGLEALRRSRADAVQVQRDEAKQGDSGMPVHTPDPTLAREFVAFAVEAGVLQVRRIQDQGGAAVAVLLQRGPVRRWRQAVAPVGILCAAPAASGLEFDMLFGPAYKGITLAAAVALQFGLRGRPVPFSYNRKEAKDHGEGGIVVGAPLRGRTVIVDDVITDGASKRESVELIRREGATPVAVLIALDRMERGGTDDNLSRHSAVMDFERDLGLPVIAIATLADLMEFLNSDARFAARGARRGGGEIPCALWGVARRRRCPPPPASSSPPWSAPCRRCRRPGPRSRPARASSSASLPTAASSPPTSPSPSA